MDYTFQYQVKFLMLQREQNIMNLEHLITYLLVKKLYYTLQECSIIFNKIILCSLLGRDASSAFVTGKFDKKEVTDDTSVLSAQQIKALDDWVQFYNENYIYKGIQYYKNYILNININKRYIL